MRTILPAGAPNYPEAWQPEEPRVLRPVLARAEAQGNRVPRQLVDEKAAVAERRPERWRGPKWQSLPLPAQAARALSAILGRPALHGKKEALRLGRCV